VGELTDFIKLSKYAGERFDLIQAGGGNTSVKLDDSAMLIKSSGYYLSEINELKGYTRVNFRKIINILENPALLTITDKKKQDIFAGRLIKEALLEPKAKPSIETFLHCLFYKYTLHSHPLTVNAITCKYNWREILTEFFPNSLLVNYKTPGVELGLELNHELKSYINQVSKKPQLVFLQNHGMIVSANTPAEVVQITEHTVSILEHYLNIDYEKYKVTNKISSLINSSENLFLISYLSEDYFLNKMLNSQKALFFNTPFCPDALVYCGVKPLHLSDLNDRTAIEEYKKKYYSLPRIIIYNSKIYCIASNTKKAKEIEEVFKFYIEVLSLSKNDINYLSNEELHYLDNWEAEKFRKNIGD